MSLPHSCCLTCTSPDVRLSNQKHASRRQNSYFAVSVIDFPKQYNTVSTVMACELLDNRKKRRGYPHLKEEALDRTMWTARYGKSFGPVVRQTAK